MNIDYQALIEGREPITPEIYEQLIISAAEINDAIEEVHFGYRWDGEGEVPVEPKCFTEASPDWKRLFHATQRSGSKDSEFRNAILEIIKVPGALAHQARATWIQKYYFGDIG